MGGQAVKSWIMTNEEQELPIDYLVDAGELDPDGDVETQFMDWYHVREG